MFDNSFIIQRRAHNRQLRRHVYEVFWVTNYRKKVRQQKLYTFISILSFHALSSPDKYRMCDMKSDKSRAIFVQQQMLSDKSCMCVTRITLIDHVALTSLNRRTYHVVQCAYSLNNLRLG